MNVCYFCKSETFESVGPLMPWTPKDGGTALLCTSCYRKVTGKDLEAQLEEISQEI